MKQAELLTSEAHRLLDLWMASSAEYYASNVATEDPILARASAAEYAVVTIVMVRSCALTNLCTTAEERLRDCIIREENRLMAEHLEGVLAKLLALPTCATPEACNASSAA